MERGRSAMSGLVYQMAIVAAMVVAGWVVMAVGVYLIGIWCFQLPLFFWTRYKPSATSVLGTSSKSPADRREEDCRMIERRNLIGFWAPASLLKVRIKELWCGQCGERELVLAIAASSRTFCSRCSSQDAFQVSTISSHR